MFILGIETSCDDTAAAVIKASGGFRKPSFLVLSNISYSQIATHRKFGGIVPNLASRDHLKKILPTIDKAFGKAKIKPEKIDLISVTCGPGLAPSLLVGINTARALAYKWQKPVIGVNHIEGHIYSNWLLPVGVNPKLQITNYKKISNSNFQFSNKPQISKTKLPAYAEASVGRQTPNSQFKIIEFPALILIVSGGHTELVLMKNYGRYKIIGRTRDDAAGEAFDKTARILGLGFPGGPAIAAEAAKITNYKLQITNKSQFSNKLKIKNLKFEIALPRPMIDSKDYDFSFSGLKTAVLYLWDDLIKIREPKDIRPVIAAEIQDAIIDVLTAKTVKAAKKYKPKTIMIAGGVAANKRLRERMAEIFDFLKIPLLVPEMSYTTDNAAMIAAAGYFNYLAKKPSRNAWKKIEMDANLKL